MSKPRLLDLFCGAGGCSMGYYRAGEDSAERYMSEEAREEAESLEGRRAQQAREYYRNHPESPLNCP